MQLKMGSTLRTVNEIISLQAQNARKGLTLKFWASLIEVKPVVCSSKSSSIRFRMVHVYSAKRSCI